MNYSTLTHILNARNLKNESERDPGFVLQTCNSSSKVTEERGLLQVQAFATHLALS